jgi:hypothetical protein
LGTRIAFNGDAQELPAGQTIWAGSAAEGDCGMAWDWIMVARGVVAMADPMCVITNLRLLGDQGEVLTAQQSARYLNEIVRGLPWQHEVRRALDGRPALLM